MRITALRTTESRRADENDGATGGDTEACRCKQVESRYECRSAGFSEVVSKGTREAKRW